jgi:hypothetical protein
MSLFSRIKPWALYQVQEARLLGRGAGSGTGDAVPIELGTGLSMTGNTLNVSSGGGTVLSPSQLTAWQNNYNPSSWGSGVQTLRIDSNSSYNFLTGLTATTGGHRVKLLNIGTYSFGLQDDEDASTAANRFAFGGQDIVVLPGRMVELEYDGTSSRWRLASAYHISFEEPEYVTNIELRYPQTMSGISNAVNAWPFYLDGAGTRTIQSVETTGFRGRWGVMALGISNADRSGYYSDNTSFSFNDDTSFGYHFYETTVRFEDLSTSTERYIARIGFLDSTTGTIIDGVHLEYSDNINSGQWAFYATDNTSVTTADSTSAVAADTWYRIRIVVYPNGTAKAYVNGTMIAEITSGLPGAGRGFAVYTGFRKTAGTTARIMYLNYIKATNVASSGR